MCRRRRGPACRTLGPSRLRSRACRTVTSDGDGTLSVVTEVAVASVAGLWSGTVTPVDADTIRIAGAGTPGRLDLEVRASPDRSQLTVEGEVDGPLATVGGAVLAAAARRLAEDVLANLADPAAAAPRRPPPTPPPPTRRPMRRSLSPGGPAAGSRPGRAPEPAPSSSWSPSCAAGAGGPGDGGGSPAFACVVFRHERTPEGGGGSP